MFYFTTELTDLQNGFQAIDTQLGSLSSTVSQLNSSVLELQEALSNISTLCGGDPTCLSLIPQSQQIMLEFNENVSYDQNHRSSEGEAPSETRVVYGLHHM